MSIVLDAGAEDMIVEEAEYGVKTLPQDFYKVKKALEDSKVKIESAEITMLPKNSIKLVGEDAKKVLNLVDSLEEHEDVQNVYANFDIPDEIISQQG
jgi:transcriptional/translational regulatory protein YebC/TACO1